MTELKALIPSRPGFLLTPFGWAAEPLAAMARAEPAFLAHLLELGRPRMHVIALALAHVEDEMTPLFALFLARASAREIVDRVLGRRPAGLTRALQRLPDGVLERDSYRGLVDLLDEPESAKLLHHADQIDDSTIRLLGEKLFKLKRFTILNHAGLHAKVYWTPNGACIGSSNASGAGLGIDEKNDIQREANVFSNDSTFVRDARFWLDKIIKESTQVGASEIKGAQRAYLPRPSGTWELIDLPISRLKNEKLAVLVWSRQATEDEMDQVYKFPDTSIKNWNCFLDSHAHVRQYLYGYHALEFNLSDDRRRLGPFQGMLRIPEQTRWRRVRGEGGMTYDIVWTEEVFQRQKRWLVPGLPPFSIGQRSKDEINKRLFERDRGICLEHCFDLGENGLLSWEPLHKLLVR